MENTFWAAPGGPSDDPEHTASVLLAELGPEACRGLLDVYEAWGLDWTSRPEYRALSRALDDYARETALAMALAVNGATIAARMSGIA